MRNMPRYDGTGPSGRGPKTGRGMGDCVGFMPQGWGGGWGMGWGDGFGFGRRHGRRMMGWNCPLCGRFDQPDKKKAKEYYEEYIKAMEESVEETKKALKELNEEK